MWDVICVALCTLNLGKWDLNGWEDANVGFVLEATGMPAVDIPLSEEQSWSLDCPPACWSKPGLSCLVRIFIGDCFQPLELADQCANLELSQRLSRAWQSGEPLHEYLVSILSINVPGWPTIRWVWEVILGNGWGQIWGQGLAGSRITTLTHSFTLLLRLKCKFLNGGKSCLIYYRTRVRSLVMLVTNWLTESLLFSGLKILKLIFKQDFEAEVWSLFCFWCLVVVMLWSSILVDHLKLGLVEMFFLKV